MKAPELSLKNIKKFSKMNERTARVSDFVSKEQLEQLHRVNAIGKQERAKFDDIDAYEAEIIARLGYDVYKDWEAGIIANKRVSRWLLAERARQSQETMAIKAILANGFAGCANHDKNGKPPKTSKNIQKIMKNEVKQMKGVR